MRARERERERQTKREGGRERGKGRGSGRGEGGEGEERENKRVLHKSFCTFHSAICADSAVV